MTRIRSTTLEGGCVLLELVSSEPQPAPEPEPAKGRWRPMNEFEHDLALAFQHIPELLNTSPFASAMANRALRGMWITDKQGDAIVAVACSWQSDVEPVLPEKYRTGAPMAD